MSYMPGIRYFEGSSLVGLKWEERGLRVLWETQHIPGYAAGYQLVSDPGGEARLQLFFAEMENASLLQFWNKPAATLHRFVLSVRAD